MKYLLEDEETDHLYFRKINISDFDQWLSFFQDPSAFQHWVAPAKEPESVCEEWYDRQFDRYKHNEGGMNALIEKSTGKLIGHCGLLVQTVGNLQELEIGYSLLRNFRHKGFATEAAKKCRDFAFENNFTDSLISIISLTNEPSAKVAVKTGMKLGKQIVYKENQVNIFRIKRMDWQEIKLKDE